ncbi:MAG: hypothetical protein Q4D33_12770, partial [Prevotellaceae bacterium]|nr:hypothetical protein [Prevotellaceae bacterium]
MKYSSIIILSLAVFFVACHTDKQPVPPVSHSQSGKNLYDMSRADSFSCVSAMVINMNRPYQAKNYQAPPIAVLNNDTAVIVAMGREQ